MNKGISHEDFTSRLFSLAKVLASREEVYLRLSQRLTKRWEEVPEDDEETVVLSACMAMADTIMMRLAAIQNEQDTLDR